MSCQIFLALTLPLISPLPSAIILANQTERKKAHEYYMLPINIYRLIMKVVSGVKHFLIFVFRRQISMDSVLPLSIRYLHFLVLIVSVSSCILLMHRVSFIVDSKESYTWFYLHCTSDRSKAT